MTKPLLFLMIVVLFAATSVAQDTNIAVTLKHGGELLGKTIKLQNVDLDVFLIKFQPRQMKLIYRL